MATVEQVIKIAMGEVGKKENPAGSNQILYNTWYYGKRVRGDAYPWCMVFLQWVFAQAGMPLEVKTASCGEFVRRMSVLHPDWVLSGNKPPQRGDILIFDWTGRRTQTSHCGLCLTVGSKETSTVEGNTAVGNDSNGGEVMIRNRRYVYISHIVRPQYDKEVEDMTIDEFVKNCTNEQAYNLMMKARVYAGSLAEPTWSKNEGWWAKSTETKIVDGTRPEDYVKRDELAAILGRSGLIVPGKSEP